MAQHEFNAPHTAAKGGCYLCTDPNDVVCTDAVIEGEGVLVLCHGCIADIKRADHTGHARFVKAQLRDVPK